MDPQHNNGITDLMIAASRGELARVEGLIAEGAEVNARDAFGYSALMYAASAGHAAVIETLLDAGADVRAKNRNHKSPLDLARAKGHAAVAQLLTNARLFLAARDGDLATLNELLDEGVDVNARLSDEWTALMIATLHNHPQVVAALLRRGAYSEAQNAAGWTALMIAERKGHTEIERLLTHGWAEQRPVSHLLTSDPALVTKDAIDLIEYPLKD